MKIKSVKPFKATIALDFENKCIYVTDEYGNVFYSENLFKEYLEDFDFLYKTYALEDDERLTDDAIELKNKLLNNIEIY